MEDIKSAALVAAAGYAFYRIVDVLYRRCCSKESSEIEKKRLIDLIGNTPLIYLESLSKLTGCDIYVT